MKNFIKITLAFLLLAPGFVSFAQAPERDAVQAWQLRLIDDKGFDDPHNIGVGRMTAHGDYLYLGTWNNGTGAKMYRSSDGERWELMGSGSFTGNRNDFVVVSIAWFGGMLYAGTWNQADGAAMFRADGEMENAAEIVWEEVTADGFGNPNNTGFTHMRAFKGHLYAGCFNYTEGSEVWRSETGEPGSWTMVIPKSWNTVNNTDSTVMLVHDDYLYIGTESARAKYETGAHLWRTDGRLSPPYDQWELVNIDGFGNPRNHNICGLGTLNGQIYAGTWNETQGIEVWRATPSETLPFADWEQVNRNGFGNPDYSLTTSMVELDGALFLSGFKWEGGLEAINAVVEYPPGTPAPSVFARTTDGLTWEVITRKGFMERPMAGVMWLEAFQGKVFVGGQAQGIPLQLWVYEPVE
jgi:hypothetical protein